MRTARKRTGRRPGNTESRQAILTAARAKFALYGYEGASIRSIAQEAGVDTALIHHFFLSKEGLFAASIHDAIEPERMVEQVLGKRRATRGLGERLARYFMGLWEAPETRDKMRSILRSALSHDRAQKMLRDFVAVEVLGPIAGSTGKSHPEVRAALAASQLIGLALTRYIVELGPIASLDAEQVVACVAPTLQRYLVGPLPESLTEDD
ncbi:TetR family transcriptional regulator [Wenjunlia tyrosinilytica]|uniref:TetR family transcriptional regulator n=2 Tax=Wenjunlia tyrosinilytica TaxID=1544741 RepID=A0A917ZWH0_9ACTN|nr:TetR family transcriptional regulator [Wenjunlia tyrosinilytica]